MILKSSRRFIVSSDPCACIGDGRVDVFERGEAAYPLPHLDLLLSLYQALASEDAD